MERQGFFAAQSTEVIYDLRPRKWATPFSVVALLAVCSHGAMAAEVSPASAVPLSTAHALIQTPETSATVITLFGLAGILGIVLLVVSLWNQLKPKPALHRQFAPINHTHPEVLPRLDHDKICEAHSVETRRQIKFAIIEGEGHRTKHDTVNREAIQRQMDTLISTLRADLKEIDRRSEERASETHSRINGLAAPLNSLLGRFEDHLSEHRSKS